MPFYENVFIARQDISASQVDTLVDGFAGAVEKQGGNVAKREYWGLRTLAYRIRKNRKGHYILLNLDASSEAVQEMERQMRINEDVLRYLTVKVDELEEGPSAMMRSRGGRDDRPRRFEGGRDDRPRRFEGGRDEARGAARRDGSDETPKANDEADAGTDKNITADGAAAKGDDK